MIGCRCMLCHNYGDRAEWDDLDRTTATHIAEHGWSVMGVLGDELSPGWSYTVGLWHSHAAPELAMFGVDPPTGKACLNALGAQGAAGAALANGQEHEEILLGYPVALRTVDPHWFQPFFGRAIAFYRVPPVPCLQVVWPDQHGRFPWQNGCDASCRDAQPQLWLPPDDHPPGVWTQDL